MPDATGIVILRNEAVMRLDELRTDKCITHPENATHTIRTNMRQCGLTLASIETSEAELQELQKQWHINRAKRVYAGLQRGEDHYFWKHRDDLIRLLKNGGLSLRDIGSSRFKLWRLTRANRRSLH